MDKTDSPKKVQIGDRVRLICHDGVERTYKIGISQEADPGNGVISNLSPLGKSLLGAKAGDTVTYSVEERKYICKVLEVF